MFDWIEVKYFLLFIIFLIGGYITVRILAKAFFLSFFESVLEIFAKKDRKSTTNNLKKEEDSHEV